MRHLKHCHLCLWKTVTSLFMPFSPSQKQASHQQGLLHRLPWISHLRLLLVLVRLPALIPSSTAHGLVYLVRRASSLSGCKCMHYNCSKSDLASFAKRPCLVKWNRSRKILPSRPNKEGPSVCLAQPLGSGQGSMTHAATPPNVKH